MILSSIVKFLTGAGPPRPWSLPPGCAWRVGALAIGDIPLESDPEIIEDQWQEGLSAPWHADPPRFTEDLWLHDRNRPM